jgi:hypothetical protein
MLSEIDVSCFESKEDFFRRQTQVTSQVVLVGNKLFMFPLAEVLNCLK